MSILQLPLSIPVSSRNLSALRVLNGSDRLHLSSSISQLSIHAVSSPFSTTIIRMGGGPRTFPGGVSKWQWKRMQAKKAKQLLKARLCRERQIYEMRKRAELKAAVSELERPWEVVERAPTLFSVGADEQLKALADRFQKPGGYDLWSEKDGPQLFRTPDGLPSARFFPKGVVHSIKPYGIVASSSGLDDSEDAKGLNSMGSVVEAGNGGSIGRGSYRRSRRSSRRRLRGGSDPDSDGEAVSSNTISRRDGWIEGNSSSLKDPRALSSTENGEIYTEASGSADERQMSAGYVQGRRRRGSSHGSSRKKRNEPKFESRNSNGLESGQFSFSSECIEEIPSVHRGRIGSSDSSSFKRKVLRRPVVSPVYNMSLQQDGSYGVQTNQ